MANGEWRNLKHHKIRYSLLIGADDIDRIRYDFIRPIAGPVAHLDRELGGIDAVEVGISTGEGDIADRLEAADLIVAENDGDFPADAITGAFFGNGGQAEGDFDRQIGKAEILQDDIGRIRSVET